MVISDTKVSNELLALASLSHPQLSCEGQMKVAGYLQVIDFEKFTDLLEQHRVWPTVYCNLKDHFSEAVPASLMTTLEKKYKCNHALSRRQFQAYCQVIKVFEAGNIPVTSLKGIPLAQRLYGDFSLRHSSDIDFLISQNDIAEAHEQLKTIGFFSRDYEDLRPEMRARYFIGNKDISYKNKDNILLELHVRLCEYASPLSLQGAKRLLAESYRDEIYEFMYLCWHASNTQFHRLKWLLDITLYYGKFSCAEKSWVDSLLRCAKNTDELRSVLIAIALCHIVFGAALPKEVEVLLCRDRVCRLLISRAVYNLEHPTYTKTWRYKIQCWIGSALLSQKWRNKWAKFVQWFRPNILLLNRYPFLPDNAVLLHYVFRMVDPLYRMIVRK